MSTKITFIGLHDKEVVPNGSITAVLKRRHECGSGTPSGAGIELQGGTTVLFFDRSLLADDVADEPIDTGEFSISKIEELTHDFTTSSEARTSKSTDRIGVYSFALKPEEHQPSGTCNFSRIDNAVLSGKTTRNATPVTVYAVNYNVLRIMSGMGGLAYSN